MFILSTYVKMLSLIFITPGNSGAAEYNFVYLFTGLISESDYNGIYVDVETCYLLYPSYCRWFNCNYVEEGET